MILSTLSLSKNTKSEVMSIPKNNHLNFVYIQDKLLFHIMVALVKYVLVSFYRYFLSIFGRFHCTSYLVFRVKYKDYLVNPVIHMVI